MRKFRRFKMPAAILFLICAIGLLTRNATRCVDGLLAERVAADAVQAERGSLPPRMYWGDTPATAINSEEFEVRFYVTGPTQVYVRQPGEMPWIGPYAADAPNPQYGREDRKQFDEQMRLAGFKN